MGLGRGNTESRSENYGVGCGGAWPNPLGQPGLLRPLPGLGGGGSPAGGAESLEAGWCLNGSVCLEARTGDTTSGHL